MGACASRPAKGSEGIKDFNDSVYYGGLGESVSALSRRSSLLRAGKAHGLIMALPDGMGDGQDIQVLKRGSLRSLRLDHLDPSNPVLLNTITSNNNNNNNSTSNNNANNANSTTIAVNGGAMEDDELPRRPDSLVLFQLDSGKGTPSPSSPAVGGDTVDTTGRDSLNSSLSESMFMHMSSLPSNSTAAGTVTPHPLPVSVTPHSLSSHSDRAATSSANRLRTPTLTPVPIKRSPLATTSSSGGVAPAAANTPVILPPITLLAVPAHYSQADSPSPSTFSDPCDAFGFTDAASPLPAPSPSAMGAFTFTIMPIRNAKSSRATRLRAQRGEAAAGGEAADSESRGRASAAGASSPFSRVEIPSLEDLLSQAGLGADTSGDDGIFGRKSPTELGLARELDLLMADVAGARSQAARNRGRGKAAAASTSASTGSISGAAGAREHGVDAADTGAYSRAGALGDPSTAAENTNTNPATSSYSAVPPLPVVRSADGRRPVLQLAMSPGGRGGMTWLDDVQSIIAATQEALLAETETDGPLATPVRSTFGGDLFGIEGPDSA